LVALSNVVKRQSSAPETLDESRNPRLEFSRHCTESCHVTANSRLRQHRRLLNYHLAQLHVRLSRTNDITTSSSLASTSFQSVHPLVKVCSHRTRCRAVRHRAACCVVLCRIPHRTAPKCTASGVNEPLDSVMYYRCKQPITCAVYSDF